MRRAVIDAERPDADVLAEAAAIIERGGIVAMPTDTLYALAVDPLSPATLSRLFAVKGRPPDRAVALVATDIAQVVEYLGVLPPAARRLALEYWPGPLTILLKRPASFPAELTAGGDRVGVRVPAHVVTQELCRASRRLLTATSANISGQPPSNDPDHIARVFAGTSVELLLDAGRTPGGPPSTVVAVVDDDVRLIRAGAITWGEVQACVRQE
jgi:L-threonylcarbamoyladenylate synthase